MSNIHKLQNNYTRELFLKLKTIEMERNLTLHSEKGRPYFIVVFLTPKHVVFSWEMIQVDPRFVTFWKFATSV